MVQTMKESKIPKILHYVWLGGKEKPEKVLKCLESWKRFCPDFEIIEWNEARFGEGQNKIVDYAIKAKNWAYAADVIRVFALEAYGGVYFDTDLELIAPIDDLLSYDAFMGYESKYWIGPAALGSVPHHPFYQKLVKRYRALEPSIGFLDNPLAVHSFSAILRMDYKVKLRGKFQVVENIALLPVEAFYPINYITLKDHRNELTRGIHHYDSSWHSKKQKRGIRVAYIARRICGKHIYGLFEKMVAYNFYLRLKKQFRRIEHEQ